MRDLYCNKVYCNKVYCNKFYASGSRVYSSVRKGAVLSICWTCVCVCVCVCVCLQVVTVDAPRV